MIYYYDNDDKIILITPMNYGLSFKAFPKIHQRFTPTHAIIDIPSKIAAANLH